LIGVGLVVAWAVAAALVLLAYRPGGPLDVLVGITLLVPIAIALAAVVWPPVARGAHAFPLMVCLGLATLLLLLPSIGGVLNQLVAQGTQTLMPSAEAAYPWALALVGTSLFSGFGLARRVQGAASQRRHRLAGGVAMAAGLTVLTGGLFAGVAIANEVALQQRAVSPVGSRFGPTTPTGEPPACDGSLGVGATASLAERMTGRFDLRPIGSVDLGGSRRADDLRWSAYVATDRQLGQYGAARVGERAWTRTPVDGWVATDPVAVDDQTVDLQVLDTALTRGYRAAAEDRGIEVLEGARARHCRISVDGTTFQEAFPQVRWLVGDADLRHWFGQLDYWVFLDGQLGQVVANANGGAGGIVPGALQGSIDVLLMATERGRDTVIYPPAA
jgi:hypothetical protein